MSAKSDLLDFLVWIQRKHKNGEPVSIEFIQAVGLYAVQYWEEQDAVA